MLHSSPAPGPRLVGPLSALLAVILFLGVAFASVKTSTSTPDISAVSVQRPDRATDDQAQPFPGSLSAEGHQNDPRPLIKVHVESLEGWQLLRSLGAELYLRGDGYAVVRLKPETLGSLESSALSWRVLSSDVRQSLYYLIPERGSPPVTSLDVRILDSDRDGFLVSTSPGVAFDAAARGYKAVPLNRALSMPQAGFHDLDFLHETVTPDDEYMYLAEMVSQDTLTAYIQHLEDYGTRYIYSPQTIKAARWLLGRFLQYGYADTLLQKAIVDKKAKLAPPNVAASKPGLTRPEFRIIVGGHYDSIISAVTVSPMESAPGADDNASGTAATLELARLLIDVPLDATVQFVCFTAEEIGLLGSAAFAAKLVSEGVPQDEVFVINMDMIANADVLPWQVALYYDIPSLPLAEFAGRIAEAYTSLIPQLSGHSSRSDHFPFQENGYPAIFVHEAGPHPNYHTVNDRLIHLEMDYMTEVVRMVMAMVLHLARVAEPPDAVTATETESGELLVEWNHSTDADVLRYHVEVLDREGELIAKHSTRDNYMALDAMTSDAASWVRVRAEDVLGESEPSEAVLIGAGELVVMGATPNPATTECRFDIFIPGTGEPVGATAKIIDASGRLVKVLHEDYLSRGSHTLRWNISSADGASVPSGIYFYVVEVDGIGRDSGKIMVLR